MFSISSSFLHLHLFCYPNLLSIHLTFLPPSVGPSISSTQWTHLQPRLQSPKSPGYYDFAFTPLFTLRAILVSFSLYPFHFWFFSGIVLAHPPPHCTQGIDDVTGEKLVAREDDKVFSLFILYYLVPAKKRIYFLYIYRNSFLGLILLSSLLCH